MAINLQIHALEMALHNTGFKIGHATNAISLDSCFGVLHHKQAILIIGIRNSKGSLWQHIEKRLLGIAIVLYGLMIIQVITSQISKDATSEFQTTNTLLGDGMTRALHESILTTCLYHASK